MENPLTLLAFSLKSNGYQSGSKATSYVPLLLFPQLLKENAKEKRIRNGTKNNLVYMINPEVIFKRIAVNRFSCSVFFTGSVSGSKYHLVQLVQLVQLVYGWCDWCNYKEGGRDLRSDIAALSLKSVVMRANGPVIY